MEIQRIKLSVEDRSLLAVFMGEDPGTHIDFNWLMPVVEKIRPMWKLSQKDLASDLMVAMFDADINTTYNHVVAFIKQRNEDK